MLVTGQTHAIMLLTAWLGGKGGAEAPLTPTEWGRFAVHLVQARLTPADLLTDSGLEASLAGWLDRKITPARVRSLLNRSAALGIALEKWSRAGLWVLTRSDEEYPKRWKHRLKGDAPPVLFGCGNKNLLKHGGIAIVGSRDLTDPQIGRTSEIAAAVARQGMAVISGGARGADEAAMLSALEAQGTAVGVLADSLLRAATSSKYRQALLRNDLALVSTFNPEAGFNVGNAMARNKYIYCLADAAVVISSTVKKGGTWAGAVENLKSGWVPLWVVPDSGPGNEGLKNIGANWLSDDVEVERLCRGVVSGAVHAPRDLVADSASERFTAALSVPEPGDHGETSPQAEAEGLGLSPAAADMVPTDVSRESLDKAGCDVVAPNVTTTPAATNIHQESPYEYFASRLVSLLSDGPRTLKEIQNATHHKQKTLSEWLRQAIDNGLIRKTRAPVKYALVDDSSPADDAKGADDEPAESDSSSADDHQTSFGF